MNTFRDIERLAVTDHTDFDDLPGKVTKLSRFARKKEGDATFNFRYLGIDVFLTLVFQKFLPTLHEVSPRSFVNSLKPIPVVEFPTSYESSAACIQLIEPCPYLVYVSLQHDISPLNEFDA
jgi:hypothetical protein